MSESSLNDFRSDLLFMRTDHVKENNNINREIKQYNLLASRFILVCEKMF